MGIGSTFSMFAEIIGNVFFVDIVTLWYDD